MEERSHRGELERVIAQQVRRYRMEANLTLGSLSEAAGISKPMLSKIENAQTSLSLTTLSGLAEALQVPVTALLRGADRGREAVLVKSGHGAIIRADNASHGREHRILGELTGESKRLTPVLVTLTSDERRVPSAQHPGSEMIYMLSGRMVYAHGSNKYELAPGDTLQFDGESDHGVDQVLELPTTFLSVTVFTPYLDPS